MLDTVGHTQNYLTDTFGFSVGVELLSRRLPAYLRKGRDYRVLSIDGEPYLGVFYKQGAFNLAAHRKGVWELKRLTGLSSIAVIPSVTPYQRKILIAERLAFIVPYSQLFVPALGALLSERASAGGPFAKPEKLAPAAQMVLLYLVYRSSAEPITQVAIAEALGFGAMKASRGIRQLEALGLVSVAKEGRSNVVVPKAEGRALWDASRDVMRNPVARASFLHREDLPPDAIPGGDAVLSYYGDLSEGSIRTYVVRCGAIRGVERIDPQWILRPEETVRVEEWDYDPLILAQRGMADPLSVALSFRDEDDERVQAAVEQMLEGVFS